MPTNYGSGRFSIGSYIAGHVRVTFVTSAPALAPRIKLELAWSIGHLHATGEMGRPVEYKITGIDGELFLGRNGPAVGAPLQLGERRHLRSLPYVQEQQTDLTLDLDWRRFERIEEYRQGGSLIFWLKLWPRAEAGGEVLDARVDEFLVTVPRDDWLAVITDITEDRTDVLEVRHQLSYAHRFQPSLSELRSAQHAVDRGDFNGAVIQARKAVSLLEEAVRAGSDQPLQAVLSDLVDQRHAKLYASLLARAKDMGNIRTHAASPREYSRVEALFALRLATLLLELLGFLLGGARIDRPSS